MICRDGIWHVKASNGTWVRSPVKNLAVRAATIVGNNAITTEVQLNSYVDGLSATAVTNACRELLKGLVDVVPASEKPVEP